MTGRTGPEFRNGYRSVFRFELERGETVAGVAESYVRDWLRSRKRGVDQDALDQWDGVEDTQLPSGASIEVTRFEDERSGQNAIRFRVTDAVSSGNYRVSVSAMANVRRESQVVFLVDVARDFGDVEDVVAAVHPPRIVENILNTRRVFDGETRLQGLPRSILRNDVDELLRAVADPSRGVPLLIAASLSPSMDERWREIVRQLTRTATGTTAVFVVSADAVEELNARLPESLRVGSGHIRAVAPKVNMENPVVRRHPLWGPDKIEAWLDAKGKPLEGALETVARGPRMLVLEAALPSDVRRIARLLDQQERKNRQSKTIEKRVADYSLRQDQSADLVEDTVAASGGIFPRRSELHARAVSPGDFWESFRALLGRWLDKDPAGITEQTLDAELHELDQRIIRDREASEVNESFLVAVEAERDDLQLEIATLKEEKDSLAVQLENARRSLDESKRTIELLRTAVEDPSVSVPDGVGKSAQSSRLEDLEDKVQQINIDAVDSSAEVNRVLRLLGQRLDPILQAELGPRLEGRPWTLALEWLDLKNGRDLGTYRRDDSSSHLRILTEELGNLGFPFEVDGSRSVSNYAMQLRELSNKLGQQQALEVADVTRAYDATGALLDLLGDDEGATIAQERRDSVMMASQGN